MTTKTGKAGRSTRTRPSKHHATVVAASTSQRQNGTTPAKHTFDCPICGGSGQLTVERRPGGRGWFVNCWSAKCKALKGEYLTALADALGHPGHGGNLLADPLRYLGEPTYDALRRAQPAQLPSTAELAGWRSRLWSERSALKWLCNKRGLTHETIRDAELGYDGEAFVIPIHDADGELVNVVRRGWPKVTRDRNGKVRKYVTLAGHNQHNGGVQLYPHALPTTTGWLLVGGLLDALLGRQHGLPCVSGTHGVGCWLPEWDQLVHKRRIAVMYDVGEERTMDDRVTTLCEAGADAWPVQLREAMERGKDLTDWLVSGRSAHELIKLISHERAASRRRAGVAA